MTKFKKTSVAVLSVTMATTLAASQMVAYANSGSIRSAAVQNETVREVSFDNLTGSIDLSDIALSQLSDKVIENGDNIETETITGNRNTTETVIVSFNVPSLVEAKGDDTDVAEFLSKSEGKRALKNIEDAQNAFFTKLASSGISYKEVDRYNTVMSGVAIEVNTAQFSKIRNFGIVSMAGISKTYAALETTDAQINPSNVYGTGIYNSSEIIKKYGVDGSGMSVAVLDTGLDYTHDAFSHDPEKVSFGRDKVEQVFDTLLAHGRNSTVTVDDLYLSQKVPFAFDYADDDADVYPSYSQHGVHVSGIIAGKDDVYVNKDGVQVGEKDDDVFDFLGAAPEAQIVVCKVFTDDLNSDDLGGATSEDIIAALDDCVTLGVDIINMSLGTACGFSNKVIDGDEEGAQLNRCYTQIKNAGISLITAAGNEYSSGSGSEFGTNLASNPDAGTVGSPSTFIGAMSVASINGQESPYMIANEGESSIYGSAPIYYNESNDANAVPFDFAEEMLGDEESGEFTYFVIPGIGSPGDYSMYVQNRLKNKAPGEKLLVVVRRGTSDFKTKVEVAKSMNADGIIVYNNVPGTIRMSLADIEEENRIPSVSINMDAGAMLTSNPTDPTRLRTEGKIKIDKSLKAGPFMNDYSSWGATPDLRLKPDITSHGGEITSTVSGGYEEMSGTSMATPNLAGLMALVRSYVKKQYEDAGQSITDVQLTTLINQIVMSTATLVYDEEKLPYSPRKQGAGLATLDNIFTTKAYLYTDGEKAAEENRPKVELGEDEQRQGTYTFKFKVKNFDKSTALTFTIVSRFMTETIASDGIAVAEAAYMLDDIPAQFSVTGATLGSDNKFTLQADSEAEITVTLKLSTEEKEYLNRYFKNGMYVEGFISLVSDTRNEEDGQCDLNLPFMGFYGDWESAPMLDYNAYEISEIDQDTSIPDDEKTHESVFATQLYSTYYNGKYAVPMGGYAYVQDEYAEQVYVTEEHCAISRFNVYNGPTDNTNYLTSTGVRALYAGLLRNAELVTYDLYDAYTGELIYKGRKFRVGKAYAGGGSARPALVDLRDDGIDADNLPLYDNGKYRIEFNFYMKAEDEGTDVNYANTFESNFYVDFDAPILQGSRIRYYDYEENNKTKQRVYLDLDIYDNHYPQSVLLCYSDEAYDPGSEEVAEINLATEYVTPIYNPGRNTTTTVSLEITDIYEKYKDFFYVQIDDYALNHSVYSINFTDNNLMNSNPDFHVVTNDRVKVSSRPGSSSRPTYELTLDKNELYKVQLSCGDANLSNYTWSSTNKNFVKVKNGELFGVAAGDSTIDITGGTTSNGGTSHSERIYVHVVDSSRNLPTPSLTFGVVKGVNDNLEVARGTVNVNAGRTFTMDIISDPWYYPLENKQFKWESSVQSIATVEDGVVTTLNKHGSTIITATMLSDTGNVTGISATVTLRVAEPFDISNMTLSRYYGSEEEVYIPNDENVMYIGEEAFKENTTMRVLHIPKTVTQISERAFLDCTALEEVYFDTDKPQDLSAISLILADAFQGCVKLKKIDLTKVKMLTVGDTVFAGCTELNEIVDMKKIGIAGAYAFAGCTKLKSIDITGLHTAGVGVFRGCTGLQDIKTAHYTAISSAMFYGCTGLQNVTINNPRVYGGTNNGAFQGCTQLKTVTFGGEEAWRDTIFKIDSYAFAGCTNLDTVNFGTYEVAYIGDYAFADTNITTFKMPKGNPALGESIFNGKAVTIDWSNNSGYETVNGAIYDGATLIKAPDTVTADFKLRPGTTAIGPYAFTDCKFETNTVDLTNVQKLGEGAFAGAGITEITIPATIEEISASAFRQSKLTRIEIPSTVKSIGAYAFASCADLADISFASSSQLKTIGDGAFQMCAIHEIELPDGAAAMGDLVFYGCVQLTNAKLPSVTSLGGYTFENCPLLNTASFGPSATASGVYTFFPGLNMVNGSFMPSALSEVDLGGLTELGEGMFYSCTSLRTIDLKGVTRIDNGVFAQCTALASVTGLEDVTYIGNIAFASLVDEATEQTTSKLTSLNLASATYIGAQAFVNSAATTLSIPAAEYIGREAFAGIKISSLELPASLKTYGGGAFMAANNLATVTIGQNDDFFVENNVLYRNVKDAKTGEITYELCLYPANRAGATYTVKDETSSILSRAFAGASDRLKTVTLPYSLKLIGAEAFTETSITTYNFNSINAPVLLAEYYQNVLEESSFRSLYYNNFDAPVLEYFTGFVPGAAASTVTIGYPSNGIGYDNFIYGMYFGSVKNLGELMDDNTRALIKLIDGFASLDEIKSWANLETTEANKAKVQEFANSVIQAHRMYSNIPTDKQRSYLNEGKDRWQALLDVDVALRPVKERFGIPFNVASIGIAPSSTLKTEYVEGEKFDITGLVLEIVYDDFITETVTDLSEVTIDSLYTGALHTYNSNIVIHYKGMSVNIPIKVTKAGGEQQPGGEEQQPGGDEQPGEQLEGEQPAGGGCAGCGSTDIGTTIGGTGLMLLTLAGVMFIIQKSRRKANK